MGMTHACIICVFLLPFSAHAINFAVCAKAPPGYQLSLYPFYYSADIRTNQAAYQDVVTRNTNEGVTVMSRLAFKF
jgi:hypothetical protein